MIKRLIKGIYFIFTFIFLISMLLAVWSGYTFISQPTKSSEMVNVIQDMYESQKSVVIDIIDLSKILINDRNESFNNEKNNFLIQNELQKDVLNDIQLEESSISEDNGDNPLGIVIEQSLSELSEKELSGLYEEQLEIEQNDLSVDE